MREKNKNRKSNIELLRIIATLGVIALHYNNPDDGGALVYSSGITKYFLLTIESVFICAVNEFVLISGYFYCESQTRDSFKLIKLLFQTSLFREAFYIIGVLTNHYDITIKEFAANLLPKNWYVIIYCALILISPYINIVLNYLHDTPRKYKIFLSIIILSFSIYPFGIDILESLFGLDISSLSTISVEGNQGGYTIVNFILMYVLGATLNKYEKYLKNIEGTKIIVLLVFDIIVILLGHDRSFEYCDPFVIVEAVLLFLMFSKLKIQSNLINKLASCSFTVYLIHGHFFPLFDIEKYSVKSLPYVATNLLVTITCIYLIGYVIDVLYKFLMRPFDKLINNLWKHHRSFTV